MQTQSHAIVVESKLFFSLSSDSSKLQMENEFYGVRRENEDISAVH